MKRAIRTVRILAFLLAGQAAGAPASGHAEGEVVLHVAEVPAIKLPVRAPPSPEEVAQIRRHIANLALIAHPDMGLASAYGGAAFAPVPQVASVGAMVLGAVRRETSGDFLELVKLGPKALPWLLAALDDRTPTKLVLGPALDSPSGVIIGGMYRLNTIAGNPANAAEQKVLGHKPAMPPGRAIEGKRVVGRRHAVTVGDVCFVIIGQITGRPSYQVSRYQPTAITLINSPTDDPELAKQVRAIWSSPDPERHLLDSLLLDFFATADLPADATPRSREQAYQVWRCGIGAATRLLYYFPDEAGDLVARRLAEHAGDVAFLKDGGGAFLQAVSWSDHPAVRQAVLRIFRETADPGVFLDCLPAVEAGDNDLVLRRMLTLVSALPARDDREPGPYGDGYRLMVAAGRRLGTGSKPVYLRFMEVDSFKRRVAMCAALREHPEWAVEILAPCLDDTREEKQWYQEVAGDDRRRPAIRVCDDAAQTIHLGNPDLPFVMHGTHANLDRQIAAMKRSIAERGVAPPAAAGADAPGK